ncbi:hypothetical protein [Bradyrhizobium prioriisuperbiae]|uniref:hypothetical protein n=1 Tax=Bradyrhizobium prioriisuperbiae TaxID=2854389 RepID=UPI0028E880D8|nr:hypothetical protein [Bradyrhizobium prioritasuperba]
MAKPESSAENAQFLKPAQNTSAHGLARPSPTMGATATPNTTDDMPKSPNYCGNLAHVRGRDCDNLCLAFLIQKPAAAMLKKQTDAKTAPHDCRPTVTILQQVAGATIGFPIADDMSSPPSMTKRSRSAPVHCRCSGQVMTPFHHLPSIPICHSIAEAYPVRTSELSAFDVRRTDHRTTSR